MDYHYESLNEHSFQKLAQALIVAAHPEAICFPVRQADGGRDAVLYNMESHGKDFIVFQVKFSDNPKVKTERNAIKNLIKLEKEKVKTLIDLGATHYYLVTNIRGSARLHSGSIDKVNSQLTEAFGIPTSVWWRDDLNARIDNSSDIKWSFIQICRATDLLQFLLYHPNQTANQNATNAITGYMGKQHGDDRDVKFKQVELKRRITDLFVDVPIGLKGGSRKRREEHRNSTEQSDLEQYLTQLNVDEDFEYDDDYMSEHDSLATNFLLNIPVQSGVSRFVLEGAPGQGKSTVTQYLCQLNRLKLLRNRLPELHSVAEEFQSATTRTPFRIDLRDYAAWVSGRHPYAMGDELPLQKGYQCSLESFLTMQIAWYSGGLNITQDNLLQFFALAHSVIVLDGFDEVADITTREKIVDEICSAADRLDTQAKSLQIIVTSRPAAFANSPGFPEDDWIHLELKDLKWKNIDEYQEKWSKIQDLTPSEQTALTDTLVEKLAQPHLRDLARNPMQLTILLQLMHVQGAALPDKRTALYEEYMKIFLNREVEKKQIAGDHRDLILSIHGLLAWVLQVQVETGQGSGRITMDELKAEIATFLEREEHERTLADNLLQGTVERVGALVSRVQGTFEFEVQPLREYFAARHLYKTAPYSPPAKPKKGTGPERFATLCKSFYWTNVTRFFCGFYDVGELPSLVDGIIDLAEETGYRSINQPRRLAMMLLGDHVFTQSPKSVRRLVNFVTEEPGFQRLTAAYDTELQRSMSLPETAGRNMLLETCIEKLNQEHNPALQRVLINVIGANADREELKSIWQTRFDNERIVSNPLREAIDFRVTRNFSVKEIIDLTNDNRRLQLQWFIETNNIEHIINDADLYAEACKALFDFELNLSFRLRHSPGNKNNPLFILKELLDPFALANRLDFPDDAVYGFERLKFFLSEYEIGEKIEGDPVIQLTEFVIELMNSSMAKWKTDLSLWSSLVDRGFDFVPRAHLFSSIALISTAVNNQQTDNSTESNIAVDGINAGVNFELGDQSALWEIDCFAPTQGLVKRIHFARKQSCDADWWCSQLEKCDGYAQIIILSTLMCWCEPPVLKSLSDRVSDILEALDKESWSNFWQNYTLVLQAANRQLTRLDEDWIMDQGNLSPRFSVALIQRLTTDADRRTVIRKYFRTYEGHDPRILRIAAEWELSSGPPENIDWLFLKRLSKLARKHGITALFSYHETRQNIDVPLDVAEEVLNSCELHTRQLVNLCEISFGTWIAKRASTVAAVADKDEWFGAMPESSAQHGKFQAASRSMLFDITSATTSLPSWNCTPSITLPRLS